MARSWPWPWPRRDGALAGCALLALLCGQAVLTGCASTLDVRTLATARADQSAFELTGRDVAALSREARLLCPQGGEILRQTARDQRLEAVDSRLERWVHFSSVWITPPEHQAQMVVVCHPVANRQLLEVAAPPSSTAAQAVLSVPETAMTTAIGLAPVAAVAAQASASAPSVATLPNAPSPPSAPSVPIGPVTAEW